MFKFPVLQISSSYLTIFKNTAFVLALNFVRRISGFLIIYVLVRTLDQTQFGYYQWLLSVFGLLSIFSLPGFTNTVVQSTSRNFFGTYLHSTKVSLKFSMISSMILLGMSIYFYLNDGQERIIALIVLALFFPFYYSFSLWRSFYIGREKFGNIFLFDSMASILITGLVILVAILIKNNILWPLCFYVFGDCLKNLIFTIYLHKKIEINEPAEEGSIRYGIKTTFYSSFNIIANHIDKLLIFSFFSPAALALYFAAEKISELAKTAGKNISLALAPKFAKTETYSDQLDKVLNIISIGLGALIIIFAFTLLPWLMNILFGEEYKEAIPYAQALLCSVPIGNHASFRNRFVNSKLDEKSNRDITITMSLIRIMASIIFVPSLGILGAVISTFIYRISNIFLLQYIINTRYRSK